MELVWPVKGCWSKETFKEKAEVLYTIDPYKDYAKKQSDLKYFHHMPLLKSKLKKQKQKQKKTALVVLWSEFGTNWCGTGSNPGKGMPLQVF